MELNMADLNKLNFMSKERFEGLSSTNVDELYFVEEKLVKDDTLVHINGNETINGKKTFSTSPILPTPTTTDNSTKAATTAHLINVLKLMYPVGSIYIGTQTTCPMSQLFGTWEKVAEDRVLQGAGTRGTVGTTINESLPNIKGTADSENSSSAGAGGSYYSNKQGAFYSYDITNKTARWASYNNTNTDKSFSLGFDASRSSSTYKDNAPVQQDAFLVNVWRRTA